MRLGDAEAGAAAGRLHEQRVAELVGRALAAAGRVVLPLARGDRDRRHHRQPGGREHDLHVGLVHADRGGEHAGADVPDPGHLEHALDGAVLAPRPVQQREDHVDVAERARRLRRLGDDQAGRAGASGASAIVARSPSTAGQPVGALDPQPLGVAGLQHPAAVGGDADRHHVVLLAVDGREHAAGGHARDGVLAGAAAEDDGDAGLAARGGGGLVHRADPIRPRLVAMTEDSPGLTARHHRRHGRAPAPRAGPAAQRADRDGLDVRRGRRPRVRPLRQPDLDGVRGRARRARGRPVPDLRLRAGRGRDGARPGRPRRARSSRPRTPTPAPCSSSPTSRPAAGSQTRLVDITDTAAVVAACDDAALVWFESPTNPALEIADIATIARRRARGRRVRRRRQHLRHSPAPAAARRSAPTSSCTRRRSTSPATATS